MNQTSDKYELTVIYGDEHCDATDGVTCYENGKTMQCDCGHWIGVKFEVSAVKCESCKIIVVDRDWQEREPPEREEEQTGLNQWT